MIVIIDYGLSNINAIKNQLKRLKLEVVISGKPEEINKATKLILPGVGNFKKGMENIKKRGLKKILDEKVLGDKIPILGICLGMQLFSDFSEEGEIEGLGWIPGKVIKFSLPDKPRIKIPHIGWNSIISKQKNNLFHSVDDSSLYYFVHSYYFDCKEEAHVLSKTHYGIDFVSAVNNENIYGTQFHPEKSHSWGIQILNNFCNRI